MNKGAFPHGAPRQRLHSTCLPFQGLLLFPFLGKYKNWKYTAVGRTPLGACVPWFSFLWVWADPVNVNGLSLSYVMWQKGFTNVMKAANQWKIIPGGPDLIRYVFKSSQSQSSLLALKRQTNMLLTAYGCSHMVRAWGQLRAAKSTSWQPPRKWGLQSYNQKEMNFDNKQGSWKRPLSLRWDHSLICHLDSTSKRP